MGAEGARQLVCKSDWLPELVPLSDFEATEYLENVYQIFHSEIIAKSPVFEGMPVKCRRDPIMDGKEAGFWHCISEGANENERIPDPRRCERVRWIRAILENASDSRIDVWTVKRNRDERVHIWFEETYLVVLGKRRRYFQLITAFCTDREHTKRKKRKERDSQQKN
jgi:hypothetical protein